MALTSIMLITLAVVFVVVPGMLYNNLNNNGLAVAQTQTLTCSSDTQTPTCQISGNVGCQASAAYCTLSGASISFLNGKSPFTQLIQGNVFGVFNQIISTGAPTTHGPFDNTGSNNYLLANCIVDNTAGNRLKQFTFDYCTQSNTDGSNMTKANTNTWNNWNTVFSSTTSSLHFYGLKTGLVNASYPFDCAENLQVNYTYSGTAYAGYTYYGCDFGNANPGAPCVTFFPPTLNCVQKTPYWGLLFAVPFQNGALDPTSSGAYSCTTYTPAPHKCFHLQIPVQLVSWESAYCYATQAKNTRPTYYFLISPTCDQFWNGVTQQSQSTSANFGLLAPLITFLIGLALILIGLGVGLTAGGSIFGTGTQFGLTTNEQGTRMAQTMGLGLVIWSFMFSEFSTWYTSGYLPYGLDGAYGVVSIILTGMLFVGLFWRMMSRD